VRYRLTDRYVTTDVAPGQPCGLAEKADDRRTVVDIPLDWGFTSFAGLVVRRVVAVSLLAVAVLVASAAPSRAWSHEGHGFHGHGVVVIGPSFYYPTAATCPEAWIKVPPSQGPAP